MNPLTRRGLLLSGAAAAIVGSLPTRAHAADDFALMRQQWRAQLVAEGYDPADPAIAPVLTRIADTAQSWWNSMNKAANRTYLWSDAQLSQHQSFAISRSFDRLRAMALAYATPGSRLAGNATLLTDLIGGFEWMVANFYKETGSIVGNWYEWQISGPTWFNDAIVLVYDRLSAAQIAKYTRAVAHYTPAPFGTAANRALSSYVVVGWGVLAGNATAVGSGVNGLGPVFPYVTSGDGFYRDGSFIQHGAHPYTGTYGTLLLEAIAPLACTVANTTWQVNTATVMAWYRDSFDPVMWRGALMDTVAGRTIARFDETERVHYQRVLKAGLALAPSAPAADRAWLRSVLKEWLLCDPESDPTPTDTVPSLLAARALVADGSVARRGELVVSKVFPRMDRIVHRRPTWALAVSMYSARIANFESINGENLRGWTTAEGAAYLYVNGSRQYVDGYWPTVNPIRLPGTTVDVRSRAQGEGAGAKSPNRWAGGASLGGRYTAGGMNVAVQGGTLGLQKSWMCFDDFVVALGTGIKATGGHRIETVVENRRLSAAANETVLVNGSVVVPASGDTATIAKVRWLHLAGTGGYVFPAPVTLGLIRQVRTRRWADITTHQSWALTTPITHTYLTAWLDHGINPNGQAYAYVMLPTATPAQTEAFAASQGASVLANTSNAQVVRAGGVTCANLWQPGTASIVTANQGVSAVISTGEGLATVALADPKHATTTMTATIALTATSVVSADAGLQVTSLNPLTINANLTGAAGSTKSVQVRTA
ncbi:polysaccharide lyase 8 family protein [Tenggerimyces flavus]|uniref:Polysaccharide lyase 8 family protein n=1 Tax=Tenggerimyces flavus TaxID=1708749 RepID=A0ABV7Y5S8_9ACTN|nr:polysaccharide lyase 8 family protein [Tenggerimyces flavus]MBM7788367.1 hyaluronate lyase [Tenggerimyces flavus]